MGVSVWPRRSSHTDAHTLTHTCAQTHVHTIVGVFPLEGKVSLPLTHSFSPFPSFPSFPPFRRHTPPHLLPLDLSFSFIPRSFSGNKMPLLPLKRGKKESVKDTEELASSNEKQGGRGQNHHRGQLWLGLCTYKCVRVSFCVCVRGSFWVW